MPWAQAAPLLRLLLLEVLQLRVVVVPTSA
jgi:hypothetical protein